MEMLMIVSKARSLCAKQPQNLTYPCEIDMPKSIVFLDWTPIFECYMVWCGSKIFVTKKTCV